MKKNLGKILIGLAVVAVLAVFFMRGDQLREFVQTIERGAPLYLAAAFVFLVGKYFAQGASFWGCFKSVAAKVPFMENVRLVFQTFFIDVVVPSLNISEATLVVEQAKQYNVPEGVSMGAALLRQISISIGFALVMIVGYAMLAIIGKLQMSWLVLGLICIAGIAVMTGVLVLAALKPKSVLGLASHLEKPVDKVMQHFGKPKVDNRVHDFVYQYSDAAKLMVHNKGWVAGEIGFATLADILEMTCFGLIAYAFGMHDIQAVVCVYIVASLLTIVSPTPQGVGVVEAGAMVAFTLFGVNQATGMAIIMVYRTVVFWLPFLLGAIMMQGNDLPSKKEQKDGKPAL